MLTNWIKKVLKIIKENLQNAEKTCKDKQKV